MKPLFKRLTSPLAALMIAPSVHALQLDCPQLQPQAELARGWSRQQMLEALTQANGQVEAWLRARTNPNYIEDAENGIPRHKVIYGPNLDGTYFYRLGSMNVTERFSLGRILPEQRTRMLTQGFPRFQPSEASAVGLLNNRARAQALRGAPRCMKHFPGGDEDLEFTEFQRHTYADPVRFQAMVAPFFEIMQTSDVPGCMMVGHAQYQPEFMGQRPMQNLGAISPARPFAGIPASFNPGVIRFAREQVRYDGLIIADWLNMEAITQFVRELNSPYADSFVIVYLALNAGIDLIPLQFANVIFDGTNAVDAREPVPQALWDDLEARLNARLPHTLRRLGHPMTQAQVNALHLETKIGILTSPATAFMADDALPPGLPETLNQHHLGTDPWNRTGVMVLLQRQWALERLLGRAQGFFSPPPARIADETRWFNALMRNREFRRAYDAIPWDTPAIQDLFCHVRRTRF